MKRLSQLCFPPHGDEHKVAVLRCLKLNVLHGENTAGLGRVNALLSQSQTSTSMSSDGIAPAAQCRSVQLLKSGFRAAVLLRL